MRIEINWKNIFWKKKYIQKFTNESTDFCLHLTDIEVVLRNLERRRRTMISYFDQANDIDAWEQRDTNDELQICDWSTLRRFCCLLNRVEQQEPIENQQAELRHLEHQYWEKKTNEDVEQQQDHLEHQLQAYK